MNATAQQIATAKSQYEAFLVQRTIESFDPENNGWHDAEQRCNEHNRIVSAILSGDRATEKNWKEFFMMKVLRADAEAAKSAAKKAANKEASADLLASIKSAGLLLGNYYKWLNTAGNPFRKEFFSKKYSAESVNAFINL